MEERKKLIGIIKLWLEDNAKNLSTYELKQIIHYCNGGDAIHNAFPTYPPGNTFYKDLGGGSLISWVNEFKIKI